MPIYSYQCKECGEISEFLVNVSSEKEELLCKKCKSKRLEKQMATSFSVGVGSGSTSNKAPVCPSGPCGCNPGSCGMNH